MIRRIILVGLLAVASLGVASAPVSAKSGDIISRGHCTGASVWKFKIKPSNGRIETEFEVDQNRNNRLWRVTLADNGVVVFRTSRYTRAPSGSFSMHRLLVNRVGRDRIVARAVNVRSGEVCRAVAIARF